MKREFLLNNCVVKMVFVWIHSSDKKTLLLFVVLITEEKIFVEGRVSGLGPRPTWGQHRYMLRPQGFGE